MEYARDSKVSTLDVLKRLVVGGKSAWTSEGWTADRICADTIRADRVIAKTVECTETPTYADDVRSWVRRGRGTNVRAIGIGSFAVGGLETDVWGDGSLVANAHQTQVRGAHALVLHGTTNRIEADHTVAIGTSHLCAQGSNAVFLGGSEPLECTASDIVLIRTPGARIDPNGECKRIVLGAERGVCTSVEPRSSLPVGPVSVPIGTTLPRDTVHWSARSSDSDPDKPELVLSFKDEQDRVYESVVHLERVA